MNSTSRSFKHKRSYSAITLDAEARVNDQVKSPGHHIFDQCNYDFAARDNRAGFAKGKHVGDHTSC